jgi:hypothetical protein
MVKAYALNLVRSFGISYYEASKFIISAEKEFRKSIILYGQVLMLDEPTAIQLISEQTAEAAVGYLSVYGIDLNEYFEEEELINLAIGLTNVAISICGDYQDEIRRTIKFVDTWLDTYGVSY